jgi:hypothetical protein
MNAMNFILWSAAILAQILCLTLGLRLTISIHGIRRLGPTVLACGWGTMFVSVFCERDMGNQLPGLFRRRTEAIMTESEYDPIGFIS